MCIYLKIYVGLFWLQLKTKALNLCLSVVGGSNKESQKHYCREKEHKLKLRTRASDSNNIEWSHKVQEDLPPKSGPVIQTCVFSF